MKYAGYVQTNREEGVDDMEQKKMVSKTRPQRKRN